MMLLSGTARRSISPSPAIAACALVLCACTEPALRITFEIPPEYREVVTSVSLQILTPPAAEPFGCEDLAFQVQVRIES